MRTTLALLLTIATATAADPGRYQVQPAKSVCVDVQTPGFIDATLLLDTHTGQTWMLTHGVSNGIFWQEVTFPRFTFTNNLPAQPLRASAPPRQTP